MSFEDHYALLGVSRHATASEIRTAYRKLVLEYHPDRHPDNPDAEETFKRLGIAYQTLSEAQDRIRYDIAYDAQQDARRRLRVVDSPAPILQPRPKKRSAPYERSARLIENRLLVGDGVIGAVLGSGLSLLCYSWLSGVALKALAWPIVGSLSGVVAGAAAGALSAAFGRAFLSSARTSAQKGIAVAVTLSLALAAGVLVAPLVALIASGFSLSLEFYDCLLGSALGAAFGGSAAGIWGSFRRLDSLEN